MTHSSVGLFQAEASYPVQDFSSSSVRPWQRSWVQSEVARPSFPKPPTVSGRVACVSVQSRHTCGALSPLESAPASDGRPQLPALGCGPLAMAAILHLQAALVVLHWLPPLPLTPPFSHWHFLGSSPRYTACVQSFLSRPAFGERALSKDEKDLLQGPQQPVRGMGFEQISLCLKPLPGVAALGHSSIA